MTAAKLDLPAYTDTDGQLDREQALLQQLADEVAALWSAGTGLALQPAAVALEDAHARVVLAEQWSPGAKTPEEPALELEEAAVSRLDRPFGRRADDLAPVLEVPTRELLGRPLTGVRAHDHRDEGRIVVELSLASA
jgi:hypothetical protein